ncbi:MAG TPA: M23 family metallopeptidase [Acidimicrobiales bacterium]|nr:M23 family metallopeptidase [Acidimicrobiales bacterium]
MGVLSVSFGGTVVSVGEVLSRISAIEARFGIDLLSPVGGVDAGRFSGLIDQAGAAELLNAAGAGGALRATDLADLADVLALQRSEIGLAPTPATSGVPVPVVIPPGSGGRRVSPLAGFELGSGFGLRTDPIDGSQKMHKGVDIGAPAGTPIAAAADGVVTWAGERGGYGQLVVIDHGGGVETRYAHQSRLDVVPGQRVAAGEMIGAVGSTGRSTGPHLHFEVRVDGEAVDPAGWLSR